MHLDFNIVESLNGINCMKVLFLFYCFMLITTCFTIPNKAASLHMQPCPAVLLSSVNGPGL